MKNTPFLWDIFCQVVDNHGDLGVCWRLSRHLVALGHHVRLYVDDASALTWMAPHHQDHASLRVLPWPSDDSLASWEACGWQRPHCVIEAFGCELPNVYLHNVLAPEPQGEKSRAWVWTWINLEYLSAEDYPNRMHKLASPVLQGAASGMTKWFFYPGFTTQTGGLLKKHVPSFLLSNEAVHEPSAQALTWPAQANLRVFVFSYEPRALKDLLLQLSRSQRSVHLKISAGRSSVFTRSVLKSPELLGQQATTQSPQVHIKKMSIEFLEHVDHAGFDALLQSSDLNFVRGEDSWVRAIWAEKPFVWQIYPQDDGVHFKKINAFLNRFEAPDSLKQAFMVWNEFEHAQFPRLSEELLGAWAQWSRQVARELNGRTDLAIQLSEFLSLKQA